MRWKYFVKTYAWIILAFLWCCQQIYTYSKDSSLPQSTNPNGPLDPVAIRGKVNNNPVPWNINPPDVDLKVKHRNKGHAQNKDDLWALNDGGDFKEGDFGGAPLEGEGNIMFKFKSNQRKVVHDSGDLCKDQDIFLAVYVHSQPENLDRRTTIRQTWGKTRLYDLQVRVVFVIGLPDPMFDVGGMKKILSLEVNKYNDIVQEDFIDNSRNVTYKAMAGLRWVQRQCKSAKFVMKTNDNTFVNMPALLKHLWDLHQTDQGNDLLMCRIWWKMHVIRDDGEWSVTKEEYPLQFYPPYCSGLAFIMSGDVARKLHSSLDSIPMLRIDDVYITGMLVHKQKLKHTQLTHTFMGSKDEQCFEQPTWYRCLILQFGNLEAWSNAWDQLLYSAKRHPIPEVRIVSPGLIAGNNDTKMLPNIPPLTNEEFDKYFQGL